jgi:hypothetical protein
LLALLALPGLLACVRAATPPTAAIRGRPADTSRLPQPPHRHAEARSTAAASMAAVVVAAAEPEPEPEQTRVWSASADMVFSDACAAAVESGRPLLMAAGAVVTLESVVQLKKGRLVIECVDPAHPPTISGACHSLFQLQGKSRLTLRHLSLVHTCAPSPSAASTVNAGVGGGSNEVNSTRTEERSVADGDDLSAVGACVFVLNKAAVVLVRPFVICGPPAGFGWCAAADDQGAGAGELSPNRHTRNGCLDGAKSVGRAAWLHAGPNRPIGNGAFRLIPSNGRRLIGPKVQDSRHLRAGCGSAAAAALPVLGMRQAWCLRVPKGQPAFG